MRLVLCVLALFAIALSGCGPTKPEISTTIQEVVKAQNASLLSQVDWKTIATAIQGRVGPETVIEIEAFLKQSAGITVRIHGAELTVSTQATGTGGRDNSAIFPELMAVQERWERADDAARADKTAWTKAVTDALLAADSRKKAEAASKSAAASTESSGASATQPSQ